MTAPEAKPDPFTVSVKASPPAVAVLGFNETIASAAATVRLNGRVLVAAVLSVTLNVNVVVPAAEGVPEMLPELESVRPAGSEPDEMDQMYGGVPPVAASGCEYAFPTEPPGKVVAVVIVMGGGLTVTTIEFDWTPFTNTTTLAIPGTEIKFDGTVAVIFVGVTDVDCR